MSPHEVIAWMRAYQAALALVRLDIQQAQHKEADQNTIDQRVKAMLSRRGSIPADEIRWDVANQSESNLGVLIRYSHEITRLHAQLQQIVDNPELFKTAVRDRSVNFFRLRTIIRRALHAYSLEFGWLVGSVEAKKHDPEAWSVRVDELYGRIADCARALDSQAGPHYKGLSVQSIFANAEPF